MSLNPLPSSGTPVGTIWAVGNSVVDWINRGNGLSGAEREALAAARAAGYTRTRLGNRTPEGRAILERDVIRAGFGILAAQQPAAPQPAPPTSRPPTVLDDVLRRNPTFNPGTRPGLPPTVPEFEDLLRRPSPGIGTRAPTTWNPDAPPRAIPRAAPGSVVGVLARAAGLLGGLLYPTPTGDSDLGYESRSDRGGEPPDLRQGPRSRFRRRPRPAPQRPPSGQTIPDRLPGSSARPVSTSPLPTTPQLFPTGGPRPTPLPRPFPAPSSTAAPRPVAFPSSSPFLPPVPRPDSPRVTMSPNQPGGSSGVVYRATPGNSPRPLTAPLPRPLPFQPPPPSDPCTCVRTSKPKRKRKPRAVCYRGSFTETRKSTLKVRKEKIPCQ